MALGKGPMTGAPQESPLDLDHTRHDNAGGPSLQGGCLLGWSRHGHQCLMTSGTCSVPRPHRELSKPAIPGLGPFLGSKCK